MLEKPEPTAASMRSIAKNTLVEVAGDADASPAARAAAARTLLEMLGDIGRLQAGRGGGEAPLHELSANELDQEIARMTGPRDKDRDKNGGSEPARGGPKRAKSLMGPLF